MTEQEMYDFIFEQLRRQFDNGAKVIEVDTHEIFMKYIDKGAVFERDMFRIKIREEGWYCDDECHDYRISLEPLLTRQVTTYTSSTSSSSSCDGTNVVGGAVVGAVVAGPVGAIIGGIIGCLW